MSAARNTFDLSPQNYVRAAGLLYFAIILLGIFGELVVRGTLVAPGDAQATAKLIATSNLLWRAGIAGDLLMHVLDIPVIVVFYLLLKPLSRGLALFGAWINIVQTCVLALNKLNLVIPLLLLGDASYLTNLPIEHRQVLALVAIKAHGYGFSIGLIFFGVACVVKGYLMMRSGFLPKILGLLFAVAGLSYLFSSTATLLAPALNALLFPWVLLPAFVGELTMSLWLIFKGVDLAQWHKRVSVSDANTTPTN